MKRQNGYGKLRGSVWRDRKTKNLRGWQAPEVFGYILRNKLALTGKWAAKWENYLCTRPDPSPPANFVTSSTETMFMSPSMECFKQDAATANSMVLWAS